MLADSGLKLFANEGQSVSDVSGYEVLNARAKGVKGLVELVHNDQDSGSNKLKCLTI